MKRVLIVTHAFSEPERVGALRARGLAKFLEDYGWEPVILTAASPVKSDYSFKVIELESEHQLTRWKKLLHLRLDTPVKEQLHLRSYKNKATLADRLFNLWQEVFVFPDAHKKWYEAAIDFVDESRVLDGIDAMISTSPPARSHLIAKTIKSKYKIPWVADFRDLWTQNAIYDYGKIRKHFERNLEVKTIRSADALTTTSYPKSEKLCNLHKREDVRAVLNGFDPEQMHLTSTLTATFTVAYTGAIYASKQDPEIFLAALKELGDQGAINLTETSVNFFGRKQDWLDEDIKKYQLQHVVKQKGQVSRQIAIETQKKSQLLLLLNWNDENEAGVLPAKLFDYLAAQRPILSTGTFGADVEKILQTTRAGLHCSTFKETKIQLKRAYDEFKLFGAVKYTGIPSQICKYSQKEMARKFAEILDTIT